MILVRIVNKKVLMHKNQSRKVTKKIAKKLKHPLSLFKKKNKIRFQKKRKQMLIK